VIYRNKDNAEVIIGKADQKNLTEQNTLFLHSL